MSELQLIQTLAPYVDALLKENPVAEGFVLVFENGTRAKYKMSEYKRLHRILTNVTTKTVWEFLMNGDAFDELLDRVPDEFHGWLKGTIKGLKDKHDAIFNAVVEDYGEVKERLAPDVCLTLFVNMPRGEIAEEFKKKQFPHLLFLYHDRNFDKMRKQIWKMVQPIYSKPFHKDIDS